MHVRIWFVEPPASPHSAGPLRVITHDLLSGYPQSVGALMLEGLNPAPLNRGAPPQEIGRPKRCVEGVGGGYAAAIRPPPRSVDRSFYDPPGSGA
jgi:hypothetical protein